MKIVMGPFRNLYLKQNFDRVAFYVDPMDLPRVPKNPIWLEKKRIKKIYKHDDDEVLYKCYFVEYETFNIEYYKSYDLEPGLFSTVDTREIPLPELFSSPNERGPRGYCHGCGKYTILRFFRYFPDADEDLGFCSEECRDSTAESNISAVYGVMD